MSKGTRQVDPTPGPYKVALFYNPNWLALSPTLPIQSVLTALQPWLKTLKNEAETGSWPKYQLNFTFSVLNRRETALVHQNLLNCLWAEGYRFVNSMNFESADGGIQVEFMFCQREGFEKEGEKSMKNSKSKSKKPEKTEEKAKDLDGVVDIDESEEVKQLDQSM